MLSLGGNVTTSFYIEVMQDKCRNMKKILHEIKYALSKENDSKGTMRTETPMKQQPIWRLQHHVSLLKTPLLAFLVYARTFRKTTRSSPSCISIMFSYWESDWQFSPWDIMANPAKYIYIYLYCSWKGKWIVCYLTYTEIWAGVYPS